MAKYTLVDEDGTEFPTDSVTYRNRLLALGYDEKTETTKPRRSRRTRKSTTETADEAHPVVADS